jgi:hypothetical protein
MTSPYISAATLLLVAVAVSSIGLRHVRPGDTPSAA